MKRRALNLSLVSVAVVAASAAGLYAFWNGRGAGKPVVTTAAVTRGDVVASVDATGTLQAVTTVQVGTQVSGTIKALHADFNDEVKKGQVVAELEPALFETQVSQAKATISRLEAEARQAAVQNDDAQLKLKRARELSARQLIPATDLETAETTARVAAAAVDSAAAQIAQAKASLSQNQVNLDHTIIRAPIDGIVISRAVDVGQTVAASMQAPTLFVIAQDLGKMQVNARVAESDIGRVAARQRVTFTVDAYPGRAFTGEVSRVRLDPVVEQNVVSYYTTIDVPNPDMLLKPGMTANVTIEVERATGVIRVPNAALRVRPTADVLAALGQAPPADADAKGGAADGAGANGTEANARRGQRQGGAGGSGSGNASERQGSRTRGAVWVMRDGHLTRVPVRIGTADASTTAIVGGDLDEGAEVVTGIAAPSATASSATPATRSPLLPAGRRPGGAGTGGGARRTN